jgi:hypothetical protein
MRRINNTILKSCNKNKITSTDNISGEIIVLSKHYVDLIMECDKLTKEGWKVQYEYAKSKCGLVGPRYYYVKLKK